MPEIPPDIITIILSVLPVTSLLRFRCVSKPWCLQIDSPDFIKLHLSRSIQTKSNLSIILSSRGSTHSLDFDKLDKATKLRTPLKVSAVYGSCNGLILLRRVGIDSLALFNPATRKHKVIPLYPYNLPALPYGLGFDALNDDYKIISAEEFVDEETGELICTKTNIYSLNYNKWKYMKAFPYRLPFTKEFTVRVGGAFHTLVDRNRVSHWPDAILVTDVVKEDYWIMELPSFVADGVERMSLDVLGAAESLCLQVVYAEFRTEFWAMKEYGVSSSWTRLFSVEPPVLPPLTTLDGLSFSKDLKRVLLSSGGDKLCWYDFKSQNFIDIPIQGLPKDDFFAYVCVGSLVPPDGFGKSNKNQQKSVNEIKKSNKKRNDFLSKGFKLKF